MRRFIQVALVFSIVWAISPTGATSSHATQIHGFNLQVTKQTHKLGYKQISAGAFHNCALRTDGKVKCWGSESARYESQSSRAVLVPFLSNVRQISAGEQSPGGPYTCFLFTNGTVKCWGRNYYGQLGDGTTDDNTIYAPGLADTKGTTVKQLSHVRQISARNSHTCAVLANRSVRCWGKGTYGQIGDGTKKNRLVAVQVKGLGSAMQISAGENHTCALLVNKTVKCWGRNQEGQLGDGTSTDRLLPVPVDGLKSVVQISAGEDHTCAVLVNHKVQCWGGNGFGQLGNGESGISSYVPVYVSQLASVIQISARDKTTCAVQSNGQVKCWGSGGYWQTLLGTGRDLSQSDVPLPVRSIRNAVQVSVGNSTACALLAIGSVKCWGENGFGQLGSVDEYLEYSSTPVPVAGL